MNSRRAVSMASSTGWDPSLSLCRMAAMSLLPVLYSRLENRVRGWRIEAAHLLRALGVRSLAVIEGEDPLFPMTASLSPSKT